MNASENPWFRDLYNEILEYDRHAIYWDVLIPWVEKGRAAFEEISYFKRLGPMNYKSEPLSMSMWNLYALGRVNDILLNCVRESSKHDSKWPPTVALSEYAGFFTNSGFTLVESDVYAPFHHEIVQVHQSADDDEPISVLGQLWPGLMFGEMLFSRSGVEVIGGKNHVIKERAEQSMLYSTYHRPNRKTVDRSSGWGSNSQWRTAFRRDYETGGKWIYNADGKTLLNEQCASLIDQDGLTTAERIELCRNRCFITTMKNDDDLYPYDDRFEEAAY